MRLHRVRFTVRRMMVAVAVVALLSAIATVDCDRDGPTHRHLGVGRGATVDVDTDLSVSGGARLKVLASTRVIVLADDYDDQHDGSPEGRAARSIWIRTLDGNDKGVAGMIVRQYLRP